MLYERSCSTKGAVQLIHWTQFCQWYFESKRFMFLMQYFILFATVAAITTRIVSLFPISVATIVKEKLRRSNSKLWSCGLASSCEKQGHYIFTATLPVATKLGRRVTYLNTLPPMALFYPCNHSQNIWNILISILQHFFASFNKFFICEGDWVLGYNSRKIWDFSDLS